MEIAGDHPGFRKHDEEVLPNLLKNIPDQVSGFDGVDQQTSDNARFTADRQQSVSISMPPTPLGQHSETPNTTKTLPQAKFYSQPMPKGATTVPLPGVETTVPGGSPQRDPPQARNPHVDRLRDTRFDSFKTWSGKLERQLSQIRGRPVQPGPESNNNGRGNAEAEALPVDRYFDALQGPELDTLRPSEELMLPEDRNWPFLLRFQISSFGICLGVSSQAILWKTLATSPSTSFLHVPLAINLILWLISVALILTVTLIYALKLILYFEAVRREYYHPIRVNFFFAPFIALLFLALGAPPSLAKTLPHALWYVLMVPFLILELKIYGQWMSGGQRRLSKVANPSNHLSIVGNFVGALLGANMGLKEGPLFFFAVGLAHYVVLFVTLYQRLPTNETLPKELHPVFFLFVAAPSVASMAWAKIQGEFDSGARITYFIAMFLYFSLVVRINFFRGFRFSLAWWAYTFPMTGAAIATIRYSNDAVTNWVTRTLAIILSSVSTLVVIGLLVTTLVHAFVFQNLFTNDIAIAISDRPAKPKPRSRKWPFPLRHGSSDTREIEQYLKYVHAEGKDLESSGGSTAATESTNGKV